MSHSTQTIHDKEFEIFIDEPTIQKRIEEIAGQINQDYAGRHPLFLCILNGAFMFASDLIKYLKFFPEISFIKVASYQGLGSTGQIKSLIGLHEEISGRDVVIIEDIIDSGLTIESILKQLKDKKAKSIRLASLLFKPDAFKGSYTVDYKGFEIPNAFVVGYGMDYDGIGRNLPDIYQLKA